MIKFDREKIFAEVDESSKRFDKYTREERMKLREDVKKFRKEFDKVKVKR